jgi:hypothetical protein
MKTILFLSFLLMGTHAFAQDCSGVLNINKGSQTTAVQANKAIATTGKAPLHTWLAKGMNGFSLYITPENSNTSEPIHFTGKAKETFELMFADGRAFEIKVFGRNADETRIDLTPEMVEEMKYMQLQVINLYVDGALNPALHATLTPSESDKLIQALNCLK